MPLQDNPCNINEVMFLARIQSLGLPGPPAEDKIYPGIFKPLIQSSRYHSSSISAMSIRLKFTVLVSNLNEQCSAAGWPE
jgi:hypothetical protein